MSDLAGDRADDEEEEGDISSSFRLSLARLFWNHIVMLRLVMPSRRASSFLASACGKGSAAKTSSNTWRCSGGTRWRRLPPAGCAFSFLS